MISFSSSIVCVIGCRWPSRGRTPGTVGSNRRRLGRRTAAAGQPVDGRFVGRLDRLLDLVEPLAGGRLVGLIDLPRPFCTAFSRPLFAPRNSIRAASSAAASPAAANAAVASRTKRVQFGQEFSKGHEHECNDEG